jgi:hypothetical protein
VTITLLRAATVLRDEAHRYWAVDGRELLGVTSVLKAAGLMESRWFHEAATTRGTFVHQALEYLDAGELVEASVDPALQGYVDAYRRFLRECPVGPVVCNEAMFADETLGYAGTIDRVRTVGPHLAVIDFKTGAAQRWHRVQLAAYAELAKRATQHAVIRRFGLYLRADGSYTFTAYTDRTDWDVFKACLTVARFQGASS